MFSEEWPLLFFTLLTQLAVGSYIFLVVIRSVSKIDKVEMGRITKLGMTIVGPVMAVGLVFSIFHLGTPLGAYRSILNWDSSWLSREIIFSGLFFALWIVGFIMERKGNYNQALGIINSVVGLIVIFSMASIYSSSILPAWSDFNTYLSFYGTTIVFGAIGSVFSMLISKDQKTTQLISVLKITGIIAVVSIAFQLIYLPVYTSSLTTDSAAALESATLISSQYFFTTIIRWVLSIAGVGIIIYSLYSSSKSKALYQWSFAALALVLVGEFLGRYLFYSIGVPIIVG